MSSIHDLQNSIPMADTNLNQSSRSSMTSSSDTDDSDAFSISSSGLTTPADEDPQSDYFPEDIDEKSKTSKPKYPSLGNLKACTSDFQSSSPRPLSATLQKAKRVAQNMMAFKRKASMRKRYATDHESERFYTLPNQYLTETIDVSETDQQESFDTVTESSIQDAIGPEDAEEHHSLNPRRVPLSLKTTILAALGTGNKSLPSSFIILACKLICFIPWCISVGGAIVLFPNHMELVAFTPGYLSSPKGLRRFAHWADCAYHHIMIFLSVVVVLTWYNPQLGVSLGGAVSARALYVWNNFSIDKTIPLGEDDQQSLYLIMTDSAFNDDRVIIGRSPNNCDTMILSSLDSNIDNIDTFN
ncbi:hypothetical protein SERLA73DRAFT_158717 [Serpula lacrymans var. lacrymans S7.3]|uniref:Uncharacterized protein n=2 Tax=Serpula lacrymans var. lacrymans TaxID=341189 RepID=F8PNB5_SERL3|nr:uncharacterized protein SERLADRAFT_413575 [Serpula lacrymans var. lacrymans S7.9]EGO03097.1 hypothetical protein SERLA73DRAFT_158717 [Serpula lacrymans var. lacrymans S7.3]EGO28859.1 hypothetical protein SERLADRAFT_413575 [Serpula lacrymans var. lacrymans S7.9]